MYLRANSNVFDKVKKKKIGKSAAEFLIFIRKEFNDYPF